MLLRGSLLEAMSLLAGANRLSQAGYKAYSLDELSSQSADIEEGFGVASGLAAHFRAAHLCGLHESLCIYLPGPINGCFEL